MNKLNKKVFRLYRRVFFCRRGQHRIIGLPLEIELCLDCGAMLRLLPPLDMEEAMAEFSKLIGDNYNYKPGEENFLRQFNGGESYGSRS